MNREEILSHVDHTLLKPEATWPQIQTLCDEAIANHTASVCTYGAATSLWEGGIALHLPTRLPLRGSCHRR